MRLTRAPPFPVLPISSVLPQSEHPPNDMLSCLFYLVTLLLVLWFNSHTNKFSGFQVYSQSCETITTICLQNFFSSCNLNFCWRLEHSFLCFCLVICKIKCITPASQDRAEERDDGLGKGWEVLSLLLDLGLEGADLGRKLGWTILTTSRWACTGPKPSTHSISNAQQTRKGRPCTQGRPRLREVMWTPAPEVTPRVSSRERCHCFCKTDPGVGSAL